MGIKTMKATEKVNILLVDDRPENLIALEAVLKKLKQNLVKAYSGEEALRCLLHQDFAVILLDVQMPGMDGFETASLIRQRERSRHTPIIFLTAFSGSDSLVFKGYSLGAVDYLLKPLEPEILYSKVAVFVDSCQKTAALERQTQQLAAINTELRQSEERFRSLSACSPVGIFLLDIDGKCTYTNPRCQTICGFDLQESLGEGWSQFLHPEDRKRAITDWRSYTQEQQELSREYRFLRKDGSIRWTHIRSSPMFSDQGDLLGHVGTIEDITETKRAEEARAQFIREQAARQQAEAANRMKDEFLAVLSHELRTPLNSILGWSQILRTRSLDAATTSRALEIIERNARLQAELIEDILDVSRIIRGKLRLNLRHTKLSPVIEAALDAVRPSADAKLIQLEADLSAATKLVNIDPDRIQQIVWNLLSNAIKFTPEGGKVQVTLHQTDSCIQIQVSDTGIGIHSDFLPHMFDRFRQADSTTTRSHGGLGLGLAIVRHLVELHHGTIQAESQGEGQGATFVVSLPLSEASSLNGLEPCQPAVANPVSPPRPANTALNGLTILVVDDEPDVRDLLMTLLEEYGATVTATDSTRRALETLQRQIPDLLISDIGMPDEDGYSLIRRIRSLEPDKGGTVPAIALTAYARDEDCALAITAGFQTHLAKPVDSSELIEIITRLVRQPVA